MAIHRLSIDDFDEVEYALIAIHTSLEDYHLAYFINKQLPILLSKNQNEIQLKVGIGEVQFSRFTYEDRETEAVWDLIQNKNEMISIPAMNKQDLFSQNTQEVATRIYLLPEFKKVDFFLKVENDDIGPDEILALLNQVDQISTIYQVDTNKIKSKNNLIF